MSIQANDCVIQAKINTDYVTVLCAKQFEMVSTTEEKEITSETDGKGKDYDYHSLSFVIKLETVMGFQDGTTPSNFDFAAYQLGFLEIPIRIIYRKGVQVKTVTANCIVKEIDDSAIANELGGSNIELWVKGIPEYADALPQLINLRIKMSGADTSGDITGLFKFRLINTDGDIIFQTDTLPEASGSNLANPIDITKPVPSGSYYYFWSVTSNGLANSFTLDAPPTKSSTFIDGLQQENSNGVQLYDFTADRFAEFILSANVPPPECVAPTILTTSGDIDNGQEGTYYVENIVLSGSQPFNIVNVVKPSWMSITMLDGYIVTISGFPTAGDDQALSFDVTNDCGTASFSTTIDIAAAPMSRPIINYNQEFSASGAASTLRIYVNGTLTYTVTTATSGTFYANAGDTIQAQLISSMIVTDNELIVQNIDDSITMYDDTTSGGTLTYSFTAVANKHYLIHSIITLS